MYDIELDVWQNGPVLVKPLKKHCLVNLNDTHIMMIGGITDTTMVWKEAEKVCKVVTTIVPIHGYICISSSLDMVA